MGFSCVERLLDFMNKAYLNKVFKIFSDNYKLVPLEVFRNNTYKSLVSTLMSSRTKDETTLTAGKKLFRKAPTLRDLNKLSEEEISKLIFPVGFYKTKARNIKKLTKIILEKHGGVIPKTKEELLTLPGIGIKTANLVLNRAFEIPAIAVDTHVHRIVNFMGWVNTKTPDKTLKELEVLIPKNYWSDMNRLFVSIGRQHTTNKRLEKFLKEKKLL